MVLARLLVVLARLLVVLARLLVGVGVLAAPQVRHGVGGVIRVHRRRSVDQEGVLFLSSYLNLTVNFFVL